MPKVSVRYIVDDVDAAIDFYCGLLGFHEDMHPAPTFAMLSRSDLRLVLSAPGGGPGGGQTMPDGTLPEPGGWNRFQLEVADLAATARSCESRAPAFEATSSPESVVSRSWWKTPPATPLNCSRRHDPRPRSRHDPEVTAAPGAGQSWL